MSVTNGPRLGLMIDAAAGDAHPNDFRTFLRGVDALTQIGVKSRTTTAQPESPTNGDSYILPTSPTGTDWGGKTAGTIAYYTTRKTVTTGGTDATTVGWDFITPKRGFYANVEDEGDACYRFDGSAWQVFYKEGSWTPTIIGSTTAGAHTYTLQIGRYRRVGGMCYASARVMLATKDAAMAGDVRIGGLPFTVANDLMHMASIWSYGAATDMPALRAAFYNNTNFLALYKNASNATVAYVAVTDIGNTTNLSIAGCFTC
jgi:hypothetical protein